MGKLELSQVNGFFADHRSNVLVETTAIFRMIATPTRGLFTPQLLTNNSVTLVSEASAAPRQLALDALVSSFSLSSAPFTDLGAQPSANFCLPQTLNPALAEQRICAV